MSILIEENEVTAVNLAVELERAVIQHVLEEDESIYVNEDGLYPFWVRIHKGSGFVSFRTHTNFKKSASHVQRLELCNELNMKNYMITANVRDDRLWFDYVLIYRDGLLRETFVRGCRQFARNVEKGLEQVDPENDFVLPPGKTESEDEKGGV